MFAKISKTVLAVAAIVMSIICAFNIWEIDQDKHLVETVRD